MADGLVEHRSDVSQHLGPHVAIVELMLDLFKQQELNGSARLSKRRLHSLTMGDTNISVKIAMNEQDRSLYHRCVVKWRSALQVVTSVRRQIIWDIQRRSLAECWPHLGVDV